MNQPHSIYSRDASVHIVTGTDKIATLDRALEASGFLENLERRYRDSGKTWDTFAIAIKPNIMTASVRELDSPVYTDPALVEAVVGRIRASGFRTIAVVEAHNVYDYSFRGRTVGAVAQMVGYSENGYRVHDLSEEPVAFDYGGSLGVHVAGRTWRDADYRVSFAKNKTHWQCFYTACIKNVYGCLPEWDKMLHYHGSGIEFYEAAVRIADRLPVHFGLLDAWVSGDGFSGHVRDSHPNATKTIMASDNVFALDWVAGEKMGLDPIQNFVMQEALHTWGPIRITREGDMTPWRPWRNVGRLPVVLLAWLEEWYHVSRFFSRAMAAHQDPRFPPVSRAQWFFGAIQGLTRVVERLLTKKAPSDPAPPRDPETRPMDPGAAGVIESFVADLLKGAGIALALALVTGIVWNRPQAIVGSTRTVLWAIGGVTAVAMIAGGLRGTVTPGWVTVALTLSFVAALTWTAVAIALGAALTAAIAAACAVGIMALWSVHRRVSYRRLGRRRRHRAHGT